MKFNNIALYFATIIVINGIFISAIFAQAVEPQALNLSGMPTIRPPVSSFISGINDDVLKSTSDNNNVTIQIRSLEAAGLPTARPAASLVISEAGDVKIKNAVVFQVVGNTFFVRTYLGETYIRWTIRTDKKTGVLKRFGGQAKVSDIAVGHILNLDGTLLPGSETLNLITSVIRDYSLENENGTSSGRVTKIDGTTKNVTIVTSEGAVVILNFNSGATIKKGAIYLQPSQIVVGDKVISVSGSYNDATKIMEASSVEIYQDKSIFIDQNFQGTIKNLSGATLPVTFTIVTKDKEYNVYLPDKGLVMKADRSLGNLKRFVEGDTIRIFGKIRETNLGTIDAELVRNLNL